MILAGDVGGTKVNLALCEVEGSRVMARSLKRYASQQFGSLNEIVLKYLSETAAENGSSTDSVKRGIEAACFGVPGPVIDGQCRTVNLPWVIEVAKPKATLGIESVRLVNDLEAMAYGIRALKEGSGLRAIRPGEELQANQALIAPGTGLGEAFLVWHKDKHLVSPSEGGHCDFAPQNEEQIELLKWLWTRHAHVSWEHVASGPGIYRIYRFLKETGREEPPGELEELFAQPGLDPSPVITSRALKGDCSICTHTLDLRMFFVGAEAGNLALKSMCRGGLYIGGGVVPHILALFQKPAFFKGFESKGRMSGIIHEIPIFAVVDQHTAMYGAALVGSDLVGNPL